MQQEKICPYPGLRPFNDDESIFFRGREKNIETIVELFEKKKFMMLTGASGDGKSSLVYAGVVPLAKAGLFKAKYNSWAVADFKPERTPLDNLTQALNKYFKFEKDEILKKELGFGFSSLVNIYKKSPLYIDIESEEWKGADESKKKQLKRKATNLLIIADQFEEFFTNSENYNDGIASSESQAVINILLETAKLALVEDLPIYIICTMRSDYIGQCAAFRGLPEYIGFSQFFVPRLKRSEIQQVIEEPAQLNGEHISSRLSQRLLFDITDGYDQLPILQHALNQIWKMANNGEHEMDLLHYAKVGGLPANQLPQEDKQKFEEWFEKLPEFKKQLFINPSLENILNAHADELLEISFSRCIENDASMAEKINQEAAKQIIKSTFQCLTKIDDARAVRNRMTLQEITNIIHDPEIDVKTVGKVLDIFREQGNTFIKPFITEDTATHKTQKHTILDITHESLIRNWDILKTWANEEYNNWLNFQDFNKQLQRWINSEKANGYLLPIGPLTFFENWYNSCNPNKYWLARYDETNVSFEEKLNKAEETLSQTKDFLKSSARKLFFTRTVMKYGANKLIAYLGLLLLVCSCTFYYFDYKRKQNNYVFNDVVQKGMELLRSNQVKEKIKAKYVINYERLNQGSAEHVMNSLECDTLAFDIANEGFSLVQNYSLTNKGAINPLVNRLLNYMDSVLSKIENKQGLAAQKNISRVNSFLKLCAYIKYHKPSPVVDKIINKHISFIENYITQTLKVSKKIKTEDFNVSLELLLTLTDCKAEKVKLIVDKISPFIKSGEKNFSSVYPKDEKTRVDFNNNYLSHKGGYQIMSYLYASIGDFNNLTKCLDSLTKYNADYKNYQNENINDIINYLMKYNNFPSTQSDEYLKKYTTYSSISKNKFIEHFINRNFERPFYVFFIQHSFPINMSLVHYFASNKNMDLLWNNYLESLLSEKDISNDKRNLNAAMLYKKRGIFSYLIQKDSTNAFNYFIKAIDYYKKIQPEFLAQEYDFYNDVGEKDKSAAKIKNSTAFLYPQLVRENGFKPLYFYFYYNPELYEDIVFPFFDFLLKKNLTELYKSKEDLKSLETFIYQYFFINKYNEVGFRKDILNYNYFKVIVAEINKNSDVGKIIDQNFIKLMLIDKAFENGDTIEAFKNYDALDLKETLSEDFQKQEDLRSDVNILLLENLAKNLALNNRKEASFKILNALINPWNKRNCLIDICYTLQKTGPVENTFVYLDSICRDIEKKPKFGMKLFRVMGMIGGQPLYYSSMNIYKAIDDKIKSRALNNFIGGIASAGFYYKAYSYIPKYISRGNELELYNEILHAELLKQLKQRINFNDKIWDKYENENYGPYIPQNYEFEQEQFERFAE